MPTHYGLDKVPKTYPAIAMPPARVPLAKNLELSTTKEAERLKTEPRLGRQANRGGMSYGGGFNNMRYTAQMAKPAYDSAASQMPYVAAASKPYVFPYRPQVVKDKPIHIENNLDSDMQTRNTHYTPKV